VEKQFSYVKKVLESRSASFSKSFQNPLFEGEPSAAEVFIHGITPAYNLFNTPGYDNFKKPISNFSSDQNRPGQFIGLYKQILLDLEIAEQNLTENDLNEMVAYPFNPETQIMRREWIGLTLMHMLTHIGQALRLQSLYIRNKL
jgi:hypothetical protein